MKKFLTVIGVAVLLAGCNWWTYHPEYSHVEYRVEGVARANIDWQGTSQNNVVLPWVVADKVLAGTAFSLSAQSLEPAGSLSVTALADGAVVATQTTADPFGFVAIYGVVP